MKRNRISVCLVTGELFPFTAGGIGRLTSNLIESALERAAEVDLHLLLPSWSELAPKTCETHFHGQVRVHKATHLDAPRSRERWGTVYPPRWAFTDTEAHADSLELMLELKALEQQGQSFDVIEFPDYLGWGFCTIQERRLGRGFAASQIAVRLHSTAGIIQAFEAQRPSMPGLGTFELERRALEDADLLVGHLEEIVDANARFYGFDETWKKKVIVQFPPLGRLPAAAPAAKAGQTSDVVFVTKVQRIKRPDLFARGAALFMRQNPSWKGNAIFACHVQDTALLASVQRAIPPDLAERFIFRGPAEREALMRSSVVVIPSDYESLNLNAYEAAHLGANLVLNERCPAFGATSPFRNEKNCWTFDGTIDGLACTLAVAVTRGRAGPLEVTPVPAYFERHSAPRLRKPTLTSASRVSVLVTNYNLGAYLNRCIESVAASNHDNVELVIVDDGSTSSLDHTVLDAIERQQTPRLKLVRNIVNRGLAASRNLGLKHCTGDYVLPLDADDLISPHFLSTAATALDTQLEFAAAVPTTGYFLTDAEAEARRFCDYAVFLGNAPSLGMLANRLSSATAMIRRSVFSQFTYDEALDSYEDWSLYLRMAQSGMRFLVSNEVAFFYRRREGSMVRSIDPERHERLVARLLATLPPARPGLVHFEALSARPAASRAPAIDTVVAHPLRYQVADRLNNLFKRSPITHERVRRNFEPISRSVERPLRYDVADWVVDVFKRR